MKLCPLPSPNRTNYEGLALRPLGAAAAAFAKDAALRARRANDGTPVTAKALSALQIFLNEKLSPQDQSQAESLVDALLEAISPDDSDSEDEPEEQVAAQDRRRKMASDVRREARRMSFDARRRFNLEMSKLFPTAVMPKQY